MITEDHILVVDDDLIVLETICDGLLMHGFNVIPAKSPSEALKKIEDKNVNYALLDLDLGTPDMNGIELGHKLKGLIPEIFILIMTGYHNVKIAVNATKEYSYYHMIKPFQVDQLLTVMERVKKEYQLEKENKNLKQKLMSLEEEIYNLKNKKKQKTNEDANYRSKSLDPNSLHTMAVESYERQKKQKSINNKNKSTKTDIDKNSDKKENIN